VLSDRRDSTSDNNAERPAPLEAARRSPGLSARSHAGKPITDSQTKLRHPLAVQRGFARPPQSAPLARPNSEIDTHGGS
jgi:hypothetical protein